MDKQLQDKFDELVAFATAHFRTRSQTLSKQIEQADKKLMQVKALEEDKADLLLREAKLKEDQLLLKEQRQLVKDQQVQLDIKAKSLESEKARLQNMLGTL